MAMEFYYLSQSSYKLVRYEKKIFTFETSLPPGINKFGMIRVYEFYSPDIGSESCNASDVIEASISMSITISIKFSHFLLHEEQTFQVML